MALLIALAIGASIGLFLGALGGGGSILTVPALVYLLHEPTRAATTDSLVIVGVTALIAAIVHGRVGRVRWGVGLAFGAIGVTASYAGTAVNRATNPDALLLGFATLVTLAATAMLMRRSAPRTSAAVEPTRLSLTTPPATPATTPPTATMAAGGVLLAEAPTCAPAAEAEQAGPLVHGRAPIIRLVAAALAVGFLTGLFGVGGGFIIVPALVTVLGLPMPVAVGTSLAVIALNSAAALAARAGHVTVHWSVVVPLAIAAVAASVAGKRVADRLHPDLLTRAFAALLIAVAAYVATTSASALIG
ncbi:MAG TPA: sulfite exporter TauE/SafE family protein [Micromonosporaceae bacterium]|jgi:hypothetical protein